MLKLKISFYINFLVENAPMQEKKIKRKLKLISSMKRCREFWGTHAKKKCYHPKLKKDAKKLALCAVS